MIAITPPQIFSKEVAQKQATPFPRQDLLTARNRFRKKRRLTGELATLKTCFGGYGRRAEYLLVGPMSQSLTARPMRHAAAYGSGNNANQHQVVGGMFRRSSSAVATSREGHSQPRPGWNEGNRLTDQTQIKF
jgi:hypothetical protein